MSNQNRTHHIKVNFPADFQSYETGNGEGMWVLVDDATYEAHQTDVAGGVFKGTLDNDSIYYPGLNHGAEVSFEMRGDKRPVALWDGFLAEMQE